MITIGNEVYELKYTVRALFVYEQITGGAYTPGRLMDDYILLYSILLAANESFDVAFDDFISKCDEDPNIFNEFKKWFLNILKQRALLQGEAKDQNQDDKKKD